MLETRVIRRFPTYDVLVSVEREPQEVVRILSEETRRSSRPLAAYPDDRLLAEQLGSSFRLTFRGSVFGGSVAPIIEGYVTPSSEGASLHIRVRNPYWWSLLWLVFALFVLGSGIAAPPSVSSWLLPAYVILVVLPLMLFGGQVLEGWRVVEAIQAVFSKAAA